MVFAPKASVRAAKAAQTHRGAVAHNPRPRPRPPPTTQTFLLVLDSRAHLVDKHKRLNVDPTNKKNDLDPDIYLGAKLREVMLPNGVCAWGQSPSKYVQESVRNCEKFLTQNFGGRYAFPKKSDNPFPTNYEAVHNGSQPHHHIEMMTLKKKLCVRAVFLPTFLLTPAECPAPQQRGS